MVIIIILLVVPGVMFFTHSKCERDGAVQIVYGGTVSMSVGPAVNGVDSQLSGPQAASPTPQVTARAHGNTSGN